MLHHKQNCTGTSVPWRVRRDASEWLWIIKWEIVEARGQLQIPAELQNNIQTALQLQPSWRTQVECSQWDLELQQLWVLRVPSPKMRRCAAACMGVRLFKQKYGLFGNKLPWCKQGPIIAVCWRSWGNPWKASVRVISAPARICTDDLPNINL
jgi:hypothetical protein